jgi:hypothetical protein
MSDFKTAIPTLSPLDPYTRVKYTMGLILGPDEFEQEQLYLMERDRLHNRALHGYGTVYGLHVDVRASADGPEVVISPGLAVDPTGQTIRVPSAQCAKLHKWLQRYQTAVGERFGTPPLPLRLYVVLCYRECKTKKVPIRVGPCHSQEDSMAPSRIADDFELSLRFEPPAQVEEDVIRDFGALLDRIEITSEPGSFVTQLEMEALVRGLGASSPLPASPPEGGASIRLHPAEACDILRAAFRVWATEVRPTLLAAERKDRTAACGAFPDGSPLPEPLDDPCVLLAQLDFSLNAAWQVMGPVTINNDQRPILLHTRLLQEWLLCGRLGRTAELGNTRTFATLFVLTPTTIRAWLHHPVLLDLLAGAVTVEIDEAPLGSPPQPVAVTQPLPGTNVFDLALSVPLAHGNRVTVRFDASSMREAASPVRTLTVALEEQEYAYLDRDGDILLAYLSVNLPALDDLSDVNAPTPGDGHVLTWNGATNQWESQPHVHAHVHALNDLSDVNTPAPANGQVLTRQGGEWIAAAPPAGVSDHGALSGLGDDDHLQYLNIPRGDRRYVQAPQGFYAIVAAGFFDVNGNPQGIGPYNGLSAVRQNNQEYLLSFPGYVDPNNNPFMYIVKGTVQERRQEQGRHTFAFVAFQPDGILVSIALDNNENISQGFMVEISQYPFG